MQSLRDVQVNFLRILRLIQGYLRSSSVGRPSSTLILICHVPHRALVSLRTYNNLRSKSRLECDPIAVYNFDPSGCRKRPHLWILCNTMPPAICRYIHALSTTLELPLSHFRTLPSTTLACPPTRACRPLRIELLHRCSELSQSFKTGDWNMARRLARQRQEGRGILTDMPKP